MLNGLFIEHCGDIVIGLDDRFNVILFNNVAELLMGFSRKEIFQQNLFAFCNKNQVVLSFDKSSLIACISSPPTFVSGYIISSDQKKNMINWKYIYSPIKNEQGTRFLILGKDITELLCFKHESKLEQDYFRNIIENLPQYIYWKDINLTYRGCNQHVANYLGLKSPKDIIGKTDNDFGWSKERIVELNNID